MAEIIAIDKKVIVMVREIAGNDTSKGPSFPGRIINLPFCTVLAKSHLGAKRDFEKWAFKFIFLWIPNTGGQGQKS